MAHADRHPAYVEGCIACKVRSVSVSARATPTRRPDALAVEATEARWERDMPAYHALRKQGLHPKQIDGSADLAARAVDKSEIEMGHLFADSETRRRVTDAMGEVKEAMA